MCQTEQSHRGIESLGWRSPESTSHELLLAPGASGYEDPVQAIVRREAEAIGAEISTDVLGTTIATVKGTAGGRTLGLFAHADQVGVSVRDAGDDGLLTPAKLANWNPRDARGQRVRITTATGEVRGVLVAPHEGEISWDVLRVDIGATDRKHALELVQPGDPIVLDGPPEALTERARPLGCARQPDRHLRGPRDSAPGCRRPARVGRRARRDGAGGEQPRRRARDGAAPRPRRRDRDRGDLRG